MKKIKSITKQNIPYHPAVGWSYIVKLNNDECFKNITDDELIERYQYNVWEYEPKYNPQILIGQEWNTDWDK